MGYVDADAHVRETDDTWSYLSADELIYKPMTLVTRREEQGMTSASIGAEVTRYWCIGDQRLPRKDSGNSRPRELELFPVGTVELTDVATRLRHMDELGVDVQVLFSTFWIMAWLDNPLADRALSRSYNRWMADATAPSAGRLRWVLKPPTTDVAASLTELEFGAEHGAVAMLMRNGDHGMRITDPYYWPLYERAQDLGLAAVAHTGSNSLGHMRRSGGMMTTNVLESFYSVLASDCDERFPRLRWGFLEAGAGWVPSLIQTHVRTSDTGFRDESMRSWLDVSPEVLADKKMYVSVFMDDDLEYLAKTVGTTNLVVGSDWGHYDQGSDPAAHRIVAKRTDVDAGALDAIVDRNARALYGIPADFTPSDASAARA